MTTDLNQPLDPTKRRCAAYKILSRLLKGDQLMQAMWMIEERDHSADRFTFLGFVGVTAEIFGISSHKISIIYIKLNKYLDLSNEQLPADPLPEMLKFRGIIQEKAPEKPQSRTAKQLVDKSVSLFRDHDLRRTPRGGDPVLTADKIHHIGQALALEAKKYDVSTIIMAHDAHETSISLSDSLAAGILSIGLDILNLGKSPLPLLYFVTQHYDGKTGVMITTDCQIKQPTDLKIIIAGEILEKEKTQRLLREFDGADLLNNQVGNQEHNNSFIHEYIGIISEDICLNRPLTIVVDGQDDATGQLAKNLLQEIGCQVIPFQSEISNDPSEKALIHTIQQHQADFGISFHQEGTILNIKDCQGQSISTEQLIMLFSKAILASSPGCEIIIDDQCSDQLIAFISSNNGRPVICKAEPLLMKSKLKISAGKFAADLSGRFYFNDRWLGFDDGLYAACRLAEIISADLQSSHEIFTSIN